LSLLAPGGILGQAQAQTSNVNVYVLVSPTTYQLDLKAIEGEIPTRTFVIKPQSVVQLNQGNNLVVATQPITQIVDSVKIQDQRGVIKELESLGNNVYSLAGIPVGNYILDVNVDLGSNKKGAYETILVILVQGQQPIPPTQIINRFKTIIIDNGNDTKGNDTDPDPNPPCPDGYELIDGNCEPMPCIEDSNDQNCEPLPNPPINKTDPDPDTPIELPEVPAEIQPDEPDQPVDNGDQDTGDDSSDDNNDNGNNDDSSDDSGDSGGLAEVPPFG
jgi:hypothetical protein